MLHLAEQYIRRLVAVKTVPQTAHVTWTFLRRAASCRPLPTFHCAPPEAYNPLSFAAPGGRN
jgi:hypothetical protein